VHQAFEREAFDGVLHRRAADAKLTGQIVRRQPVTRKEASAQDAFEDGVVAPSRLVGAAPAALLAGSIRRRPLGHLPVTRPAGGPRRSIRWKAPAHDAMCSICPICAIAD
jgi:hypothetical protein